MATAVKSLRLLGIVSLPVPLYLIFYYNGQYKQHDVRELSASEVESAQKSLGLLTPSPPNASGIPRQEQQQHLSNLNQYGATILKESLTLGQVADWNCKLQKAFSVSLESKHDTTFRNDAERHHLKLHKRTFPAYHADLAELGGEHQWRNQLMNSSKSDDKKNDQIIQQMEQVVQVAKHFFQTRGITNYRLTQLQFLNAFPGSGNQIWHVDNTSAGLTAIVSLGNVRANGPTELLLESHKQKNPFHFARSSFFDWINHQYILKNKNSNDDDAPQKRNITTTTLSSQPLLACLDAGDAILYDSRLLHRGRGYSNNNQEPSAIEVNSSDGSSDSNGMVGNDVKNSQEMMDRRPVLALRWDAVETPPPGGGILVTTTNRYIGAWFYAVLWACGKS